MSLLRELHADIEAIIFFAIGRVKSQRAEPAEQVHAFAHLRFGFIGRYAAVEDRLDKQLVLDRLQKRDAAGRVELQARVGWAVLLRALGTFLLEDVYHLMAQFEGGASHEALADHR